MALDDIVIGESDNQEFTAEVPVGNLNSPVDILTETSSNSGAAESELFIEVSSTFII